jgi:hypothetical protein
MQSGINKEMTITADVAKVIRFVTYIVTNFDRKTRQ